jgi:hypothetical protein
MDPDEVMPSSSTCWLPGAWLGACGAMAPLVPPYPALLVPVMVMELVSIFPGLAVVAVTRALPHHVVASPPRRMVSSSLPSPLISLLPLVIYLAPLLLLLPNDQKIMQECSPCNVDVNSLSG